MFIYILIGIMVMSGLKEIEGRDYLQEDKFFKKVGAYILGVMAWPALIAMAIFSITKDADTIREELDKRKLDNLHNKER